MDKQIYGWPGIDYLLSLKTRPRFHGNGFCQWYVNPRQRLHIWSEDLPAFRDHNATIHNHRFDMTSQILYGSLQHRTYSIRETTIDPTHDLYQLNGASDPKSKPGTRLCSVKAEVKHSYIMKEGSMYTHNSPSFHDSISTVGMTVTLMTKEKPKRPMEYAQILSAVGTGYPTHAFEPSLQPPEEKLIGVYKKAHKLISASYFE